MFRGAVIVGYGINCDRETKSILEYVGFDTEIVHINDLISGKKKFCDFHLIVFAGGFSYGDDLGSGKAFATKIKNHLWEDLLNYEKNFGLILGICNGFQIITHLGLFSDGCGEKTSALIYNDSSRYICKWVNFKINKNSPCIFTKGIENLKIPIAHSEGKFYASFENIEKLEKENRIVLKYLENPNGSIKNIAGICNKTGRVFGLMPHPERASFFHQKEDFHKLKEKLKRNKKKIPYEGEGILIFRNALKYLKNNYKNLKK